MVARGGSMGAAIPHGSRITLEPRPVALGDVVAARVGVPRRLVIHRVIGVDDTGALLLCGDTCVDVDGWVMPADVLGVVVPR
jgi:hypothetical protein